MTTLYSQSVPSPLIWSSATGAYDEMLASITGTEYTPDMAFYRLPKAVYLIFGYVMVDNKIYPVFAPNQTFEPEDLYAYMGATGNSFYYWGVWANPGRSMYKVATQNITYESVGASVQHSKSYPSPLVWTIKAGYYDANLVATEFATATRYITDASLYPVTSNNVDTWFMIFGYVADNNTLMPVFPGQYGIASDLKLAMGQFFHYPWIHMGFWANEQRTSYVEKKVYNQVYADWSALNEPNSPYTLPAMNRDDILSNVYYPYTPTITTYTIVGTELLNPPTGPAVTENLQIIGYHVESGTTFPVFAPGNAPTHATVRYTYWHDFYNKPGGTSSNARAYTVEMVGPNNNFKLTTFSVAKPT